MNAKQLFIDAFRAQQQEEAAARAERIIRETEKTIIAFKRLTGFDLASTDVIDGNIITISDDLVLKYNYRDPRGSWQVRGRCPRCGRNCWSYECYSKEGIGERLVEFAVDYSDHDCVIPGDVTRRPTWQEKLAAALAEAVQEVSQ